MTEQTLSASGGVGAWIQEMPLERARQELEAEGATFRSEAGDKPLRGLVVDESGETGANIGRFLPDRSSGQSNIATAPGGFTETILSRQIEAFLPA